MSKLPVTDAKRLEKILLKLGFKIVRQKGSHRFYRHDDGRYTTIPHHGNDDLGRPLIREILKQVEVSPEQYQQMLHEGGLGLGEFLQTQGDGWPHYMLAKKPDAESMEAQEQMLKECVVKYFE